MADKKLAKKLAKMTEEERAAFLEKKRLQDEEEKKKKEEMLYRFLKNKLLKEEETSRVNMLKVQKQWRDIMRRVKTEELGKEIAVMKQAFEKKVDRKDAIVRSLAKDLDEAEEQYQIALRTHLHKVAELSDFQERRVKDLEDGYKKELTSLQTEFDDDRETMKKRHEQEMKDLGDIIYAMELRYSEREAEAAQNFQSLMDELKNKNLEDTHSLNAQRKAVLDDLWTEFQKETKHYKESTEERKQKFEALKSKDEESSNTIARQMRKLHRLQDSIASLRHKMASLAKETEEKTRAIKQDREILLTHFHSLKREMMRCRELERSNLTTLTLQSDEAIKELQRKKDKVQQVLKVAEMCRKMETEVEKVMPFYASSLSAEEEQQAQEELSAPLSEPLAEVAKDYLPLEKFWKRFNKVQMDRLALEREKTVLKDENVKLRAILKQYLDGISVNADVLDHPNALVITTKKTPEAVRPEVPVGDTRVQHLNAEFLKTAPITVVEAAHVAKHLL